MKTGVAAVALAASALLAPTATAQNGGRLDRGVSADQLRGGQAVVNNRSGFQNQRTRRNVTRNRRAPVLNIYGQTLREANILSSNAAHTCASQLELDGHRYGFVDAGFKVTPYVEQTGKNRFIVKGTAKLFDGYRYSIQHYECGIRRGSIRGASSLTPANFARNRVRQRRASFGSFGFSFGSHR